MKRILFLTDVDGTLVAGGKLHPRVISAAREFTARGNYLALATGRNQFSIGALSRQIGVNAPCVILAGAAVFDPASRLCRHVIPIREEIKDILKRILREYPEELAIQVFTDKGQFNLRLNAFLRRHGIPEEIGKPDADVSAMEGRKILKVGLCCEDTTVLEDCAARYFSDPRRYRWHYSFPIAIEVLDPAASKGAALSSLLGDGSIQPDLVAVAGDSANDLPMFPCGDIRFAPRDAIEDIRAAADHVVSTAAEGCVADALNILMEMQKKTPQAQ